MRKKLIEVALPLDAINAASVREGYIYKGNPSSIHKWWAQRPLAACRAVLFGQLVDDPSSWPKLFPTEKEQNRERQRLFRIIESMVPWEASNDETIINATRLEIARSLARGRMADDAGDKRDASVLTKGVNPEVVNKYLAGVAPPVHDPFAGGGSIPLEAQRLGLRAIATDLNPVAVLVNKALVEIPPKFNGMRPVNPESRRRAGLKTWKGAQGLAEDVRYYGQWILDQAKRRIGHLYPQVELPQKHGGGKGTVLAWLWARTVPSPNPAFKGQPVPLVSSFWISKTKGREAWVSPILDREHNTWHFKMNEGKPSDPRTVAAGTKIGRASFKCILSGDPIPTAYIRKEGQEGRIGQRLMAIVALSQSRKKVCIAPLKEHETIVSSAKPDWKPDYEFAKNSRHMTPFGYGLTTFAKLFTSRQLVTLDLLSSLVQEAHDRALQDASLARGCDSGPTSPIEVAEGIALILALSVSKLADYHTNLVTWYAGEARTSHVFTSNALPMVWDYVENNPFCSIGGSFSKNIRIVADSIEGIGKAAPVPSGVVRQDDATIESAWRSTGVVSTDPPYYDNVPYADLSDIFYIWLRRSAAWLFPSVFGTVLVPKSPELVADPFRHGSQSSADEFFMVGMQSVLERMRESGSKSVKAFPISIYYAFKQSESNRDGFSSTGWASFLESVVASGWMVVGTWPIRTERSGRKRSHGSNALATSIVLVCRKRPDNAPTIDRATFRRLLARELSSALKHLQRGNIAPVDVAQASIGPGMAIFSRHAKVIEADGSAMSVRTALQLINQALDEYLTKQEGEFGPDTRFAVTWFETHGFEAGPYGDAETLAKARNVAVQGIVEAGVIYSAAGKVRLLKRDDLPEDWDPETDTRLTIWECAQHLIKRLESGGEIAAADLLARLGNKAEPARDLAYRLYQTCERKGWAEEARAYNGLVVAWPELTRLAAQQETASPAQTELF